MYYTNFFDHAPTRKTKINLKMSCFFIKTVYSVPVNKNVVTFIKTQLGSNPTWATRAIVKLHERQTIDEQNQQTTKESNGVGFNGMDATILSSFANQIHMGRTLSQKQLAIAFKKLPKYSRQVIEMISVDKIAEIESKLVTDWPSTTVDESQLVFLSIDIFRVTLYDNYMILLNINDLIKFALESVTNYILTFLLIGMLGSFVAALMVYVAEKVGGVIITSVILIRSKKENEISKKNDDNDWRLEKLW